MYFKSERILVWSILFLMLIFIVRDILGVNINPYAITLLLSLIACSLSYKDLIAYSCFLLPLSCGIQSFIWVVVAGCIIYRKGKISNRALSLFLLFVILEIIDQSRTIIYDINIKNTLFYFTSLFLVLYLVHDEYSNADYAKNVRYFIYGSCFLLFALFTRIILHFGIEEVLTGVLRYKLDDITLSGDYVFFTNANNLGLYSATCFSILLYLGQINLKISRFLYVVLITVVVIGGMLTFSRTWLLLSLGALLMYLLVRKKNAYFLLLLLIIAVVFTFALSSDYFMSIVEVFETRMTADDIKDGAGRIDLFSLYNDFFKNHSEYWITGTGAMYYLQICQQPNSIHNMIQQTYICYGVLGLIGVGLLFSGILSKNRIYITTMLQYAPLVCYVLFIQTVQFFNPIFCMYPLVACVYCLKVKQD